MSLASKAAVPVLILVSIALIVLLQLGFIFLLLALLPSVAAYFIDTNAGKPLFKTVLSCNFAATLPSLAPMIRASIHLHHYDVAPILQDPLIWLFVYSGAAAGWGLIFLCRFIARFIVTIMYEYSITSLENLQRHLVEEWGPQIKQPPTG